MSTELELRSLDLPVNPYDASDWDSIISSSAFLPRIQLFGGNSDAAKEGKIGIGRYGLVKGKDVIDLGNEVECIPLAWRFKAMRFGDGEVISVHNPKHPQFIEIQELADVPNSGAMFGVEFLLFLPNEDEGIYATFYLNSKSSRRQAPDLKALTKPPHPATLKAVLVTKGKFKWHVPLVVKCSTPFSNLPSGEEILEQVMRFVNPKDTLPQETVTEEEASSADRPR